MTLLGGIAWLLLEGTHGLLVARALGVALLLEYRQAYVSLSFTQTTATDLVLLPALWLGSSRLLLLVRLVAVWLGATVRVGSVHVSPQSCLLCCLVLSLQGQANALR